MATVRLLDAVEPEAGRIARASWLTVCASLLWVIIAAAIAVTLDGLVHKQIDQWSLVGAAFVVLVVGCGRAILLLLSSAMLERAADEVLARERRSLVTSQSRLSPRANRASSAAVAAMITDKLPRLVPFIIRFRPAMRRALVVPLALALIAVPFSWAVAIIFLIAGPLIPVFMALVGLAARKASEQQMEEIGTLSGLLAERLAALIDIRLLDATGRVSTEFQTRTEQLRVKTMAVLRVAFLSSAVLEFFAALGVAMVAVYVGFALLGEIGFGAWARPLTLAEGVFLLMLAPEFFQPLRDFAAGWHDKAAAVAVAGELAAFEEERPDQILGEGGSAQRLDHVPTIATRNLALEPLSLPNVTIIPGESIALTGPSGSGKSTLLALIGGLQKAGSGAVLLDDAPLTDEIADAWRTLIAWLPQTTHFFAGPLRESLLADAPDGVDDDQISGALAAASASSVVDRLPLGLDTPLGETGGGVSGGEARRLMLARAFLSQRPVVLADEPTADLDSETAAEVIAALRTLHKQGATVIVATHDPALMDAMTRRVSLEMTNQGVAA